MKQNAFAVTATILLASIARVPSATAQPVPPTIPLSVPAQRITASSSGFELTSVGGVPMAALARANGDLAVDHPTTNQIVVFDRAGRLKHVIGKTGQGPGEFTSLDGLGEFGDTIWARDSETQRFTLFRSDSTFVRTVTINRNWGGTRAANLQGMFTGGLVYAQVAGLAPLARLPEPAADRIPLFVARTDGTGVRQLATMLRRSFVPTVRYGRANIGLGGGEFGDGSLISHSPESDRFVILEQRIPTSERPATYVVTTLRPTGDTLWRRSLTYVPRRVPDSLSAGIREWVASSATRAVSDSVMRVLPRFLAPVSEIVVGAGGSVWIGERGPGDQNTWRMLDAQGVERVRVTLHRGHQVIAARGEDLWTVTLDADDVPVLNRFRVVLP